MRLDKQNNSKRGDKFKVAAGMPGTGGYRSGLKMRRLVTGDVGAANEILRTTAVKSNRRIEIGWQGDGC